MYGVATRVVAKICRPFFMGLVCMRGITISQHGANPGPTRRASGAFGLALWATAVQPARSVRMGAAFSRARERPFFHLLLPWPFRPRSRARRAKRPPASKAEDKSDAIEMEPVPQLTSALKQQDAAAQAQEWCLQFLGGDGPDAGPEHFAPKLKRSTADASRRQREAEEAEAEERASEFDEAAALELEEQVHDEVARLRRLRTAELAGCMGASADLAMLLGAAELVSARAAADG